MVDTEEKDFLLASQQQTHDTSEKWRPDTNNEEQAKVSSKSFRSGWVRRDDGEDDVSSFVKSTTLRG